MRFDSPPARVLQLMDKAGIPYKLSKDEEFTLGPCYILAGVPEEDFKMVLQFVKMDYRKRNYVWTNSRPLGSDEIELTNQLIAKVSGQNSSDQI